MKRVPDLYPKVLDDPGWARKYAESSAKRNRRIAKSFARMIADGGFEKGRILDVGCGAGEVLVELAHAFPNAELVGVDLSQPILDIARSSAQEAGLADRVTFEKGDVQAMPFEGGSFDVVISLNMLHYVDDPVAMFNEIERVLAPGGMFGLGAIKRSWLALIWPIFRMAYTAAEARELLQRSDLRTWELKESFLVITVAAGSSVGLQS